MVETGPKILVVDDDPDLLDAVSDLLEDAGYRVKRADGGPSALELLRAGLRPAMMIVDYGMAEMTGADLLEACAQTPELAGIPAVLTSGFRACELPPDTGHLVLRKPFQADQLLEQVARVVGRPR